MSRTTSDINKLVEMLPENEQILAYELVKRMVLAWDSDYTKLTMEEKNILDEAKKDFEEDNIVSHDEIDWS